MEPARFSGNDLLQTILPGESCRNLWQDFIQMCTTRSHKNPAKNRSTFSYITAFQQCTMQLWQDRDRRDQERDNCFVRMCAVDMYTDVFTASLICSLFWSATWSMSISFTSRLWSTFSSISPTSSSSTLHTYITYINLHKSFHGNCDTWFVTQNLFSRTCFIGVVTPEFWPKTFNFTVVVLWVMYLYLSSPGKNSYVSRDLLVMF